MTGAAFTVYFGQRAASVWDQRQQHCPAHRCDAQAVAASDRAAAFARAADVAAVVTAAAVGFGLYAVLSSGPASAPRSSVVVQSKRDRAELQWTQEF